MTAWLLVVIYSHVVLSGFISHTATPYPSKEKCEAVLLESFKKNHDVPGAYGFCVQGLSTEPPIEESRAP